MDNTYKTGIGCYVDGARGIHAVDAIIHFAMNHGHKPETSECCDAGDPTSCVPFIDCEFWNEHEDEATDYMNEHYAVDGASWGRNENGDWGLWGNESD